MTISYQVSRYLPMLCESSDIKASALALEQSLTAQVEDETNQNLSNGQKALLMWHQKLNHVGYSYVHWLAKAGFLGNKAKLISAALQGSLPICATCQFAKQERRSKGTTLTKVRKDKQYGLQREVLKPGQVIAMDHYVHSVKGRAANLFGSSGCHYVGGTIFVDIATSQIKMIHQTSLNAHETLASKAKFAQEGKTFGVTVKSHHTDNGIFAARAFTLKLLEDGQDIHFSGVGAKHQNGIADHAIKTTTYMA